MTNLNEYLTSRLALIEKKQQKRSLPKAQAIKDKALPYVMVDRQKLLNFSSNDYLGLSRHPQMIEAALAATKAYGTGSRSSRLVSGHISEIAELESDLARYRGTEAALVFSSGYAANVGTISALLDSNDLVLADKLAHACLLDGAKLSGASTYRFAHHNLEHLEKLLLIHREQYANCLIITESIFSMDGDVAPIDDLLKLAQRYNCWLMVDDAHGFGMSNKLLAPVTTFKNGMISGTFSKGAGALGGYVAGSAALKDFLVNFARSFMFSTALPPAVIAAAHQAVKLVGAESSLAQIALENARYFTKALDLAEAQSPIVPLIIGENETALDLMQQLAKDGIYVQAIRPPTVPPGTARLRLTFTAVHEKAHIDQLIDALKQRLESIKKAE